MIKSTDLITFGALESLGWAHTNTNWYSKGVFDLWFFKSWTLQVRPMASNERPKTIAENLTAISELEMAISNHYDQATTETLKDNAFMNGGNTDEQKSFYLLGFKDGAASTDSAILTRSHQEEMKAQKAINWLLLEQYLAAKKKEGCERFEIGFTDATHIYIHPVEKDGGTIDFEIKIPYYLKSNP